MELSVVFPAYNSSESIGSTLKVILDVKEVELEVIVVADGSTDEVSIVIEQFVKDRRASQIRQKNSGGPAWLSNKIVAASSGEYIRFLDPHDIVVSEEKKTVLHVLSCSPKVLMICSSFHASDQDLDIRSDKEYRAA